MIGPLHLSPDQLIDVVTKVSRQVVKESQSTHPEDVMAQVLTATEVIYAFVSNLPRT